MKNSQKTQIKWKTFHNLQSHLACCHTKICTLIRHTICESLVKIHHFSHEYSLIIYENNEKNAIKSDSHPELTVTSGMSI